MAVGAICHLTLGFADSLVIGFVAGCCSSLGYAYVQPYLEEKFNLHDSCGINNLHGIPSVIGSLASIVLVAIKGPLSHDYPDVLPYKDGQVGEQCVAVFLTFGFAIASGLLTGKLLYALRTVPSEALCFEDKVYWEVEGANEDKTAAHSNHGHKVSHVSGVIQPLSPEKQAKRDTRVHPTSPSINEGSASGGVEDFDA